MESYTVVLTGEFVECVEAENPKEAEQLAIRLANLSIGKGMSYFTVTNTKICLSPSQEKQDATNPG